MVYVVIYVSNVGNVIFQLPPPFPRKKIVCGAKILNQEITVINESYVVLILQTKLKRN